MPTVFDLLRRLAMGSSDAKIVCTSTLTATEIAIARAEDRMAVLEDCIGFVFVPGTTAESRGLSPS